MSQEAQTAFHPTHPLYNDDKIRLIPVTARSSPRFHSYAQLPPPSLYLHLHMENIRKMAESTMSLSFSTFLILSIIIRGVICITDIPVEEKESNLNRSNLVHNKNERTPSPIMNVLNSNDTKGGGIREKGNISDHEETGVHLMVWKYDYVRKPFLIVIFLVTMCIWKILFVHCRRLRENLPESCMLMILGLCIGGLLLVGEATEELKFLKFSSQSFFLYLLPPIVLEAAYSLKDRVFVDNLSTILLYAVLGTMLHVIIVAPALYGLSSFLGTTWTLTFLECIMFSVIVAAVDPVAVVAIFKDMGVNKMLYFIVLGESLFNDGVVIVLYDSVLEFMKMNHIGPKEFSFGVLRFLIVCVGSTIIGLVAGFATAFITKFSSKIQSIEPLLLYGLAYISYLAADLFDFSGIISLICCGLIQCHYAMENISSKSYISIRHFSHVASEVNESLIFIILSVMAVNSYEAWADWNVGFALLALFLCIVGRFIVTFGLGFCVNRWFLGVRKIGKRDMFVMAFGGLRGTLTFSLAFSLDYHLLKEGQKTQHVLLTGAFVVIFLTTFFMGITMKPLVGWINVRLHHQKTSIIEEINIAVLEQTSSALEIVLGVRGTHYWAEKAKYLSRRYLRPIVNKYPHKKYNSVLTAYQIALIESRNEENWDGIGLDGGTLPTSNGYLHHLEHLDSIRHPNAASAAILDRQDSIRRQMMKSQSRRSSADYPGRIIPASLEIAANAHNDSQPESRRSSVWSNSPEQTIKSNQSNDEHNSNTQSKKDSNV